MLVRTEEFCTSAAHFKEFGVYCKYQRGSRSYMNFWKEETKRCLEGYNPGFDNISGYHYWYQNYSPIYQVRPIPDKNGNIVYNENGTIQGERFVDFPLFWDGDYQYYHYLDQAEKEAKHGVVLKTRGRGYSFKGGSMLDRNFFLIPGSRSFAIASEKEYLLKDGLLTKAWEMMDFVNEHTAWSKRRQVKDTDLHKRASYKATQNGRPLELGYRSEIMGVTLKNDPQRARGKRGKLMLFEESGKLPYLQQAWLIAQNSMEQGGTVFGLMVAFGTGGTEGADFDGLQELFDNPKGYNILAVNNTWDDVQEETKCGFFMPEFMNMEGYMDNQGNSLIIPARLAIEKAREVVSQNTKDRHALKRYIAEKPITPREAMMRLEGNIFPTQDILNTLAKLEIDPSYEKGIYKGKMIINPDGQVDFKEDKNAKIIYNFPIKKSDDTNGPVVLYEQPFKYEDGTIPHGVYVAGIDPYDHDKAGTSSLGSLLIVNKLTNKIVAEYTARPDTAKEFYEQCRRLLLYYNARALYENEKKGIFDYFESQGSLFLLCPEPKLIDDILKNPSKNSRKFGLKMPEQIKRFGEGLIYQWLIQDYDLSKNIKVYHKIKSIGVLKELAAYDPNPKKNFDRVMSLMCLVYQINEERAYIPDLEETQKSKPFHEQDFFNRPLFGNSAYTAIKKNSNF